MKIAEGWKRLLSTEFEKPYMKDLKRFLAQEYSSRTVYPPKENIFRALQLTDYSDVKVCILGQDPYHGWKQANGLAFAVSDDVSMPPSLRNIFKEIESEYGSRPNSMTLEGWAQQGVLLLNTVLTVRSGEANSHRDRGWETFTRRVIQLLGEREERVVFILWGSAARKNKVFINGRNHIILESAHPSPLSAYRGFVGCNHFSKANSCLKEKIDWVRAGGGA